jgi:CubicO group peptidase (beta-lactamase class C family)
MKKMFLPVLLAVTIFTSCKKSHVVKSDPPLQKTYNFDTLTTIVQNNLAQLGNNAGLLVMNKAGKVLYKQYFGSYSDSTYIQTESGSKWLSAATIMTLVDQGLIKLDDNASKFYPTEFAAADRKNMTIRELLSHTSGFENYETSDVWVNTTTISLQDAVKGIGQSGYIGGTYFAPATVPYLPNGSQFAYSAVGMQVSGGIAENVSGKDWDMLFNDNIGSKCNMPNTNYLALGNTTNYRIAGGAGTRMMEYANFLLMLINDGKFNGKQVLSSASVAEILKDQTNGVPISYTPYTGDPLRENYRYGLGCWIEASENGQASEIDCQGEFGFSPWIDLDRGFIGILFVKTNVLSIDETPTAYTAPYTLIRNEIAQILDN